MKKKLISIFILIFVCIFSLSLTSCNKKEEELNLTLLTRNDWEKDVKNNLNELIKTYRNQNEYVVFDFDNTTCIFDIEEQLIVYQLETMSFELNPTELKTMLGVGLSTTDRSISGYGYFGDHDNYQMTYDDLIDDIYTAYYTLYNNSNYGPFTYKGLSEAKQTSISQTAEHKEFKTKMRMMYDLVCDKESTEVAYPWITYWFSGMTEEELYSFSSRSHNYYKTVESEIVNWHTDGASSKTGSVDIEWTKGIRVSDNLVELYNAFTKNGIDVWVVSASAVDVVRAAVDAFGLHDICKGVIGMTNKLVNNKFVNEYDYISGVGYYTKANGGWEKMTAPIKTQTQAKGKVTAIMNTLYNEYSKKGPIAGFGDSTGDFNFCTEFDSLKLALFFNRANRKVTDGGGLIAPLAMYQKDVLKYDLKKANSNGDTLYLLQGRDENGTRSLRDSNETLLIGQSTGKLYRNNDNLALYNLFKKYNLSTKYIVDNFSHITQSENILGFKYGFFNSYNGYHNIKNNQ